jgi:hypothetical protein
MKRGVIGESALYAWESIEVVKDLPNVGEPWSDSGENASV